MKNHKISFLLLLFYIVGTQTVTGQGTVTVTYNKEKKVVDIKNNGKSKIIFFPYNYQQSIKDYYPGDSIPPHLAVYHPLNTSFDGCGIKSGGFNKPAVVHPNATVVMTGVKKEPTSFIYYTVNEKNKIDDTKHDAFKSQNSPQESQKTETPFSILDKKEEKAPETKPETEPETKPESNKEKNNPSKSVIKPISGKQTKQVTIDELFDIRYTFTGKFREATWRKQDVKVTLPDVKVYVTGNNITIMGRISEPATYTCSIIVTDENGKNPAGASHRLKVVENGNNKLTEQEEELLAEEDDPDNDLEIENTVPEQSESSKNSYVIIMGVILALLLAIGITFYVRTMLKNKKIKQQEEEKKKTSGKSMLLIEDDDTVNTISYKVDLSDIRKQTGETYYEINMLSIFENSAIRNVYFNRTTILDIYKFFSDFLKYDARTNETGCFLVGRWEYAPNTDQQMYDISIESIVEPGDDVIYGEYNLNFGAQIGITLDYTIGNLCEKTGNEYVHTAWMHSHPGLGLFLSSQDLNVQSQLAHSNHPGRLLAIVIDSNSPDLQMAFFACRQDGTMNNDNDLKQTLSLETLYQWAKTLPHQDKGQNYFIMNILPQRGKISRALFTGAAIVDMDMAITPDNIGIQGYFYGTCQGNEILINDFKETTNDDNNPLSCLLIVSDFSYKETLEDYSSHINPFEMAVVYSLADGNIYLLTKNEQSKYPEIKDKTPFVSLMKMKEWTRRKR